MIAFVDVSLIFAFTLLRRLPRRIYDYMTSDRLLTAATLFHHFSFDSESLVFTRFTASDATSKHHHQWTEKWRWIAWEMLRSELLSLSDTFFCAVVERVNFSSVHRRSLSRRWLKKLTDSRSPSIEHTSMLLLAVECEWRELILQLRFSFILSFNQSRRHYFFCIVGVVIEHIFSLFSTLSGNVSLEDY